MDKQISSGIVHEDTKLKMLIAENPDLPIVVLAGECANTGDYGWQYCTYLYCKISEILDCETPFNHDYVYSDREDFENDLDNYLSSRYDHELSDEEFSELFKKEVARYEPHWKKVIAIMADNL